mmetsp:Transcript_20050/g.30391  ORF Transcript_20050/g.30391 Transcript_20050/m.30391 type:complete len:365 (+) Transcript_20050:72-1166(+)|eukprot:CAMPEP_0194200130 /NCGR_PEP_ID=MMETSP0156-20130528/875_1 /TAXON_ID=33649 /ORGANISM="Thalassionema nitzschioides, Strain L26-B" /LENGTH=364 /DNA_ID=CAMNT_0038925097 /DNA_START=8 /DNA_END=1102 /DNA_ORIENTATION=+
MASASNGATSPVPQKKRRLSPTQDTPVLSPTLIHAASQVAAGFPATQAAIATGTLPSKEQIKVASMAKVKELPPIVHLSKTDTAPQLKIENYLTVKGGMRGYRTSRATHGVNSGDYYYECWIMPGPTADEIKDILPSNARLAPKLKEQLQNGKNPGAHSRIGWSMRLGDLQAPVGYDKWSYGYRDISGSRVHKSRREDGWGGEPYKPGDVVGFAIASELHKIYFFRNGVAMGQFIISRGKREGGAAFDDIAEGVYYPAISVFLGGGVRANFGPHFVYNPRKLPHGLKVKPVSELCERPKPVAEIADRMKDLPKKTDETFVKSLEEALKAEAEVRIESYEQHYRQHVEDVKREREARNLSTGDLM